MVDIKAQKPARRYAEAFFETILDKDYNQILSEIANFLEAAENSFELKNFLYHPIVSLNDKKDAISQIAKNFQRETLNFIFLLLDEDRLDCLDEIYDFLKDKINSKNNIRIMDVTLAFEPDENLKNVIKSRLENKFQSTININFYKDEAIIGGLLIKEKDTLYDFSIKKKIENFKSM